MVLGHPQDLLRGCRPDTFEPSPTGHDPWWLPTPTRHVDVDDQFCRPLERRRWSASSQHLENDPGRGLNRGLEVVTGVGLGQEYASVWDWSRYPVSFLALVLWATTMYHLAPPERAHWPSPSATRC